MKWLMGWLISTLMGWLISLLRGRLTPSTSGSGSNLLKSGAITVGYMVMKKSERPSMKPQRYNARYAPPICSGGGNGRVLTQKGDGGSISSFCVMIASAWSCI